jgi:hypothetical protein
MDEEDAVAEADATLFGDDEEEDENDEEEDENDEEE